MPDFRYRYRRARKGFTAIVDGVVFRHPATHARSDALQAANIDALKFEHCYSDGVNKGKVKQYNLPRRECDLVVSGYSVKYRHAIIDRWHELEAKNKMVLPDFTNPAIAARAWADEVEQKMIALT